MASIIVSLFKPADAQKMGDLAEGNFKRLVLGPETCAGELLSTLVGVPEGGRAAFYSQGPNGKLVEEPLDNYSSTFRELQSGGSESEAKNLPFPCAHPPDHCLCRPTALPASMLDPADHAAFFRGHLGF